MPHRPTSIYICCDPTTLEPRYVGKTVRPVGERINNHCCEKGSNHKARWFMKIKKPYYFVAEIVPPGESWIEAEQFWIAYLKSLGANLTNSTIGGDGATGNVPTEEVRRKISAALMGHPGYVRTPEILAKISAARKGVPFSMAGRAKLSATTKGRPATHPMTDEIKAKISATAIANMTPERRKRLSEANKGCVVSEETKNKRKEAWENKTSEERSIINAKISKTNMGHVQSEETKAKISAAHSGRTHTPESRKNMSDAHKGKPSGRKGALASMELKAKLSAVHKGRITSPETKAKMSVTHKARHAAKLLQLSL